MKSLEPQNAARAEVGAVADHGDEDDGDDPAERDESGHHHGRRAGFLVCRP